MNKKISSHWALGLIAVLAIVAGTFIWTGAKKQSDFGFGSDSQNRVLAQKDACRPRIFKGSAKIKVWKTVEDGKSVLRADSGESSNFPLGKTSDFQLIDPTSAVAQKLESSSQEDPVELEISGFASLCDGTSLASLQYEDGIFKPYILN